MVKTDDDHFYSQEDVEDFQDKFCQRTNLIGKPLELFGHIYSFQIQDMHLTLASSTDNPWIGNCSQPLAKCWKILCHRTGVLQARGYEYYCVHYIF